MYQVIKVPFQRKHTLAFLELAKKHQSVYLHTEVDISGMFDKMKRGQSSSYLAWLIYAISNVIKKYPRANSYYCSGFSSSIIEYDSVHAKFTLDNSMSKERIVLSGVISKSDKLSINQIKEQIDKYKSQNTDDFKSYKDIKILHKLPLFIGKHLMSLALKHPKKAARIQGTFSISSLGKCDVTVFFPVTTTTLGFGVGKIKSKSFVNENNTHPKAYLPLTMCFDHRVIDGALAGEILSKIKKEIENSTIGGAHV